MNSNAITRPGKYALATGADAVGRLNVLHRIYSDAGREALFDAGLTEGMRVADFGCGVGEITRTLASLVGSSGRVTAIDQPRMPETYSRGDGVRCRRSGCSRARPAHVSRVRAQADELNRLFQESAGLGGMPCVSTARRRSCRGARVLTVRCAPR